MKKLENYISYSVYKYASESFKLYFNKKEIRLDSQTASELGYLAITDKGKLMIEIKKYIRNKTSLKNKLKPIRIGIRTTNKNEYIYINELYPVDRFNVKEKLDQFKTLKNTHLKGQYNIKITEAKMIEFGKFEKSVEKQIETNLIKRVVYIQ